MRELLRNVGEIPEYKKLIDYLKGGGSSVLLTGADRIHKVHLTACIRVATDRPVAIICPDEIEAGRIARDLETMLEESVGVLCQRDFTFYNAEGVSRQMEQARLKILAMLAQNSLGALVSTAPSLMQRCIPEKVLARSMFDLEPAQEISIKDVLKRLVNAGYSAADQVEGIGQFASRGGILDFYSPYHDMPVRCEFWGDEIDTISFFDPITQRRGDGIERAVILPVAETLIMPEQKGNLLDALRSYAKRLSRRKNKPEKFIETLLADIERIENDAALPSADKYMDIIYKDFETAADFLPKSAIVLIDEPANIAQRSKSYLWQAGEDIKSLLEAQVLEGSIAKYNIDLEYVGNKIKGRQIVQTQSFTAATGSDVFPAPDMLITLKAKQLGSFGISLDTAVEDIKHYTTGDMRAIILCQDERRAKLLAESLLQGGIKAALDFEPDKLPVKGKCLVTKGALSCGFEYTKACLAVLTEGAHVSTLKRTKKSRSSKDRQKLTSYADLSPGDLVVHEQHGIGRFVGIFPITVDGSKKDFIKIAYNGADTLYVPATNLDLVSKYIGGGEGRSVKLSKMGGTDWSKTKTRAKSAAKDLAKGLIQLYSQRQQLQGHAFAADSIWQTEFEQVFEYELTEDQAVSVDEIKADMEKKVPMDRILCGDVGYGKTEVALRAVMKCVLDGKQAAILVPTTVLAQQHYQTAIERFSKYPVKIEVLSRFKTPKMIKKSAAAIARGETDIVIGTHRLIQKDVKFKDLGLFVVDEEQRFGVSHKEQLKEMSKNVDALTLSATPIPRTLNMAMTGIRDMSTIQEPPQDRHPIQTYVLEHDWGIIADAIRREVARGGQVYYLHNRVDNIERTAARIMEMVPGINVSAAHGKMDETTISKVMQSMNAGETQVLVCTTIIETGIDIPNVNTLIIEDADRFGLSQLHQIRGRVGRSTRHAFAYLTYRQGRVLSEVASKRLSAIREFAEFNSGFKIAMRDLEIRGAGNLLGSEQSGHMVSVGYDMYLKLLDEAVVEVKGEKREAARECAVELEVSANIPEKYVRSPEQRMDLYRSIARVRDEESAGDMIDELIDRYGEPPESVVNLVNVALLRGNAAKQHIIDIAQKSGLLQIKFSTFDMQKISAVYPIFNKRIKVMAGNVPAIELGLIKGQSALETAMGFIKAYKEAGSEKSGEQ